MAIIVAYAVITDNAIDTLSSNIATSREEFIGDVTNDELMTAEQAGTFYDMTIANRNIRETRFGNTLFEDAANVTIVAVARKI